PPRPHHHPPPPSFPTRRSSDLARRPTPSQSPLVSPPPFRHHRPLYRNEPRPILDESGWPDPDGEEQGRANRHPDPCLHRQDLAIDRKSTRLNSSHRTISYAVFC